MRSNGQLQLFINPNFARGSRALVLHVGSETFAFADATSKNAGNRRWNSSGLTWTDGGSVVLKLTEAANSAASGAPLISGTALVGLDLTAAKGTIADTDGTTKADNGNSGFAYTYQWVRVDADGVSNETDISGATSSTYTLATADVGKKVKARASFLDDEDALETRTSAAYPSGATITEATTPTVTLVLEPSASIGENGDFAVVKATLDHASTQDSDVFVTVTPVSPAVAGDYEENPNDRLRIDAGDTESRTSSVVSITAVDNDIYTGNKTLSISATATNDLGINAPQPVTLTIVEDDAVGVTVSETALTVTEEDTTGDTYTVVLDSEPTASVTIAVGGHASTAVSATPASLTFTTTNWSTAKTVTVTAVNDTNTANETVSLTHSATSTDTNYDAITIAEVTVTVEDNDTATDDLPWSTTMTVGEGTEHTTGGVTAKPRGFNDFANDFGTLADEDFVYASTTLEIDNLVANSWVEGSGEVVLNLSGTITDAQLDALILEFAGETLPLADATATFSSGDSGAWNAVWSAAWVATNASSLTLANYRTTLAAGGTVNVCLRTSTQVCPGGTTTDDLPWSTTMTVAVATFSSNAWGYGDAPGDDDYGTLSDTTLTYDSNNYKIDKLYASDEDGSNDGQVNLVVNINGGESYTNIERLHPGVCRRGV